MKTLSSSPFKIAFESFFVSLIIVVLFDLLALELCRQVNSSDLLFYSIVFISSITLIWGIFTVYKNKRAYKGWILLWCGILNGLLLPFFALLSIAASC
ncbi:MAG: hypothetical protein JST26_11530 [Bacteroidetes bacterium]|nr:hypothetical protein [Bacteroidota bacterium]